MITINNSQIKPVVHNDRKVSRIQVMPRPQYHSPKRETTDVSFKGLEKILTKNIVQFDNYNQLIKLFDKAYDGTGQKLLNELSGTFSERGSRITQKAEQLIIEDKSILRNLTESALFPFTKLPLHLLNFFSEIGKKIPLINKGANAIYDSKLLTNFRNKISVDAKTDMLRGILRSTDKAVKPLLEKGETLESLLSKPGQIDEVTKELFKKSNRFFNTATGNYNTAYERPLNRIVTGLIPAAFLANDAYNLSVMCGDTKEQSEKEAVSRKKQEISRVFTNAYIQLVTLGTFTKLINSNATASALISAATVLVAETVGRLANSRPVLFLTKDRAKAFNKKLEEKEKRKSEKTGLFGKKDKNQTQKAAASTPINPINKVKKSFRGENRKAKKAEKENKDQKTVVSFDTLKKAVVALSLGGIALAFLKNSTVLDKNKTYKAFKNSIKSVGDFFQKNVYDKLCKQDFEVSVNDFQKTMNRLDEVGLSNIAHTYREIAGDLTGKSVIKLKNGNKILKTSTKIQPAVDFVIQPFKFAISVVTLPYRIIKGVVKASTNVIQSKIEKGERISSLERKIFNVVNEIFGKAKDKKPQTLNDIFAYSIPNLIKKAQKVEAGDITNGQFKDFVQTSIQRSFNTISQSKNSNTDLAMITKIASSTVTSAFLIADNYNMVMLKSDGEDKETAVQKAKERLVQRISGLFYQTLFMKLFNSTFQATYHKSLLGMSAVSGSNTVATEFFTRKSIGMPIGRKTKEELIAIDEKNLNRKGLAGKYFRFMSQLTGKKSLGDRVAEKNKKSGKIKNKNKTKEQPYNVSTLMYNNIPSKVTKL